MLGPMGVKEYSGSYSDSVAEKAKFQEIALKKYDEQQTFIE